MRRVVLAAATAALTIAGCGGSSETMKQLRARAGNVCLAASGRAAQVAPPQRPGGGAAFLQRGIAVVGPELTALRALRAPPDAAKDYEAALLAFSQKLRDLRTASRAIQRGADPAITIRILQARLAPLESQEDGAWQALGIPACLNH